MKAKDLITADNGFKPNFDFFDFRQDVPDISDFDDIVIDESFYIRESALQVRAIRSYVVKIQDLFTTAVREKVALIDNEEFEFYYCKILQSLMDLRLFYRNINRKIK